MRLRLFFLIIISVHILAACSNSPQAGDDCTASQDCISAEICLGGQCTPTVSRRACQSEADCPDTHYCDPSNQCVSLISPDGGSPGPDGSLRDDGSISNLDDGGGQGSQDSGVSMMCINDQECSPPNQICESNQCVDGCGINAALCDSSTEICDPSTGRCVQVSCNDDMDCSPPMTVCESNQCIPGCHLNGGIPCSGATPCNANSGRCEAATPCSLDSDCNDPDKICVNQSCMTKCNLPGGIACVSPQVCNPQSGRCINGGVALGQACSLDSECAPDFCLPLRNAAMMTQRVCSRTCGASSDCPISFLCAYIQGTRMCIPSTFFNPPGNFNVPTGGMCTESSNNCQSGWCNTGINQCIETCSRNADCSTTGGNCWTRSETNSSMNNTFGHLCFPQTNSADGASCGSNANCNSGLCNRYTTSCAKLCCSDTDCSGNTVCTVYDVDAATAYISKVCRPPQTGMAGSGNSPLGTSCTIASDCISGACAPMDPFMPTGARKCSTTCCTDADCSVLPLGGKCRPIPGPTINNITTIVGHCIPN